MLRPEFMRNLAREVRWRLPKSIDGRRAKNQDVGKLPDLLATYPDPNADPTPSLSHESFAAIAAELGGTAATRHRSRRSSAIWIARRKRCCSMS